MSRTVLNSLVVAAVAACVGAAGYLMYGRESKEPCRARRGNASTSRPGDPNVLPGGRPEDIALAQSDPDEYAWRLFLAINRQALAGERGLPDPNRPTVVEYEDDKPVIWETWALSSGGRDGRRPLPKVNRSEVFRNGGQKPEPWERLGREGKSLELFPSKQSAGLTQLVESQEISALKRERASLLEIQNSVERSVVEPRFIDPGIAQQTEGVGEEVRMNRATFDHIVEHNLYNIEGLEEAFRRYRDSPDPNNPEKIDVPAASQEIKAKWVRIREEDKPRYHWRSLTGENGEAQIWGLTALHITTKDLQDWFWSDFEHVDYLNLPVHGVGAGFSPDMDRAEITSRDGTTRTSNGEAAHAAVDCQGKKLEGVREETAATKWEYYRLRGTQTTFTCADLFNCAEGPTVLANTQLERGFQQTSSCITCHSRASIGLRADVNANFYPARMSIFLSIQQVMPTGYLLFGAIGKKDDNWFLDPETKKLRYMPTDFMWALPERALSTKVLTPEPSAEGPACNQPCPVPSPSKPNP